MGRDLRLNAAVELGLGTLAAGEEAVGQKTSLGSGVIALDALMEQGVDTMRKRRAADSLERRPNVSGGRVLTKLMPAMSLCRDDGIAKSPLACIRLTAILMGTRALPPAAGPVMGSSKISKGRRPPWVASRADTLDRNMGINSRLEGRSQGSQHRIQR